ncbi:hypothetical protein Tco_0909883 [Tanacetum coccineum]|uniref:Uncharacterized protein n=1 Tax=Tanacetum coccineum TaxID=301880 RepID=A0ABQ5CUK2_9ASTR
MPGRPRKERIKAPSENNSQVLGRGDRGGRNGTANRGPQLMDEDEIRENLEHDYMQDLLDAQDKNKGKAIQEGSNSKSSAKPVRKSKRLRQEEPQPFRIYVKNRGRLERIAKLQGKNYKFNAQGTIKPLLCLNLNDFYPLLLLPSVVKL